MKRAARHDSLTLGAPCPSTGEPYDGFSWTREHPYDSCRACADPSDPMRAGLSSCLADLNSKRENTEPKPSWTTKHPT